MRNKLQGLTGEEGENARRRKGAEVWLGTKGRKGGREERRDKFDPLFGNFLTYLASYLRR